MSAIEHLLKPRSVAVIGASADPSKTSGRPISYLLHHGYAGRILPVNPRVQTIGDLVCYTDVASLPETPDVAIILLGPDKANEAVRALAARGTPAAIVLASGYGEVGELGRVRQEALKRAAGAMRILGPNTIGLANLTDRIMLSASGALELDQLQAGNIAVVSQSGGILGSLLSRATAAGIGFSKLVSTSNEVDLDLADFVDYLVDDEATDVIAIYMEGLRRPDVFRRAALRAALAGKQIVVFKVGRSEAGARSAISHTGAMAGADAMYEALFRQVGIVRADRFTDLLDIPAAFATRRALRGKRVAILTSTGGAGTLVADSLGMADLETPPPGEDTASKLRALQNDDQIVMDRNPIDVTLAGLQPELLKRAIATLLESADYDAVVTVVGSSALANPTLASNAIKACLDTSQKPVFAYVSPHAPEVLKGLNQVGCPSFTTPESIASAFKAMRFHAEHEAMRTETETLATHNGVRSNDGAPEVIDPLDCALTGQFDGAVINELDVSTLTGQLDEAQARALFTRYGIASVREWQVDDGESGQTHAATLTSPVVVKVLSSKITHKTEIGGVAVGVAPGDVGRTISAMQSRVMERCGFAPDGFLIQEMVSGGTELILGFHRDPQLGSSILVGMGGVTAELFKDTAIRLLPIDRTTAVDMVQSLTTWPLLNGYRGRPPADVEALVDAIVAFASMAEQLGDRLIEAEINPLFVLEQGRGVLAADGIAVLA
jgi:acyl-CoA synthetase (NDP forming)